MYPEPIIKPVNYQRTLDQVLLLTRIYPNEVRGDRRYLVRDLRRKVWETVGPYHHDALKEHLNKSYYQIFELPDVVM